MSAPASSRLRDTHRSRPARPHADVVVGVSGGVDSAVALMRLRDTGVPVRAVFMKNWEEDDHDGCCAAARDLADATAVCEALGVALGTVNLSYEYWERVFQSFLEEHRRGRTPNPDVLCNREVKFRAFLDHARSLGAESIATGHYARRTRRDGRWRLLRARDEMGRRVDVGGVMTGNINSALEIPVFRHRRRIVNLRRTDRAFSGTILVHWIRKIDYVFKVYSHFILRHLTL